MGGVRERREERRGIGSREREEGGRRGEKKEEEGGKWGWKGAGFLHGSELKISAVALGGRLLRFEVEVGAGKGACSGWSPKVPKGSVRTILLFPSHCPA